VKPTLIASLALAGFAIGWIQRTLIVALAVPAGQPPRQACPACGYQIFPSRLMSARPALPPSSRCPACRARAGPPPLATELTAGLVLGALAARLPPGPVLAAACWLAICAVPLAFIDAAAHRLPDVLTAPAYAGTAALLLLAAATSGQWHNLVRAGLGGIALAGFYLALVLINPSGMGMGDAKLAASLGTLLAWSGWGTLFVGAFAGFLLGGVYGVALLMSGRATRKQHIPFGPFMIAGAFLVILAHMSGLTSLEAVPLT
jgi:leader peptidase (prepilin peptidase) / N-methyltransferase